MRPGIIQCARSPRTHRRHGGETQDRCGAGQQGHHAPRNLAAFDTLAEIVGRAAHHQAGDEHGQQDEQDHAVQAGPDAAVDDLAEQHVEQHQHPAKRRQAVVHGVDRAAGGVRGRRREQRGAEHAETHFLAFHVGYGPARNLLQEVRTVQLAEVDPQHAADEQGQHDGPDRPRVTAAAHGVPEEEHQRARDDQDVERLEEAGQRRGVLKRMRGVHVEEAAAVGPEQLDRNLRRNGPGGDELLPALKRGRGNARVEILDHTLPEHDQRPDDAQRQQHVQRNAHEIGPEIADGRGFVAGDATHDRGAHGDADGCGNEILIGQGHHLREMAHGGFAAVGLPVRIRQEADRRIQGQIPRKAGEALRIQRQLILKKQHPEREQEPRKGKSDEADGVPAPRLVFVGMNAGQRVHAPLHRPQDRMQEGAAAGKNLMDIPTQQRAERR